MVYSSIGECYASVWCRGAHISLIDSVNIDALCVTTGCLHSIPIYDLFILARIQLAGLRCLGATLFQAKRSIHHPNHLVRFCPNIFFEVLSIKSWVFTSRDIFRCYFSLFFLCLFIILQFCCVPNGNTGHKWGSPEHKSFQLFFCKKQVKHGIFTLQMDFSFVLNQRRMVDTKLTPSRKQKTIVIKYERHKAYERINAKTGKHGKTKNSSRLHCTYHGMSLVSLLMLHLVEFFEAKFV